MASHKIFRIYDSNPTERRHKNSTSPSAVHLLTPTILYRKRSTSAQLAKSLVFSTYLCARLSLSLHHKFHIMYYVKKRLEISAAHQLQLSYESKCENLHGHNWIITVYCRAQELNPDGMVIDFSVIKKCIKERLDHKNLNDILPFNPSAENMARWICEEIPHCYKVEVQESENNTACYEAD